MNNLQKLLKCKCEQCDIILNYDAKINIHICKCRNFQIQNRIEGGRLIFSYYFGNNRISQSISVFEDQIINIYNDCNIIIFSLSFNDFIEKLNSKTFTKYVMKQVNIL